MSPGKQIEDNNLLRDRIAELEAELTRERNRHPSNEFRHWLDQVPMMVRISGVDAMCTFLNRAWLEYRGRGMEPEMGNGWTEGLHPDDRDLCIEAYLKAFTARQPYKSQYRLRRADGEYVWVEETGQPRFDAVGTFSGYVTAATDISDRKQAMFSPDEESVRLVFALTERERQVLVLIAEGKSTKEAAAVLGISYKTADSHRSRILEKLGVHETASMVRYAIRAGLIAP